MLNCMRARYLNVEIVRANTLKYLTLMFLESKVFHNFWAEGAIRYSGKGGYCLGALGVSFAARSIISDQLF